MTLTVVRAYFAFLYLFLGYVITKRLRTTDMGQHLMAHQIQMRTNPERLIRSMVQRNDYMKCRTKNQNRMQTFHDHKSIGTTLLLSTLKISFNQIQAVRM